MITIPATLSHQAKSRELMITRSSDLKFINLSKPLGSPVWPLVLLTVRGTLCGKHKLTPCETVPGRLMSSVYKLLRIPVPCDRTSCYESFMSYTPACRQQPEKPSQMPSQRILLVAIESLVPGFLEMSSEEDSPIERDVAKDSWPAKREGTEP